MFLENFCFHVIFGNDYLIQIAYVSYFFLIKVECIGMMECFLKIAIQRDAELINTNH